MLEDHNLKIRVQFRRATSSAWTSTNVILAAGEVGFETDTNKIKFGDGQTAWSELLYANLSSVGSVYSVTAGKGLVGGTITNTGTISLDKNYVATLEDKQILSNKTFGSTLDYLTSISTSSNTLTLDLTQGPDYYISLNSNINTVTFINKPDYGRLSYFTLIVRNPAKYTLAWPPSIHWENNTTPQLSTDGKEDVYFFLTTDGGETFYATALGIKYDNPNLPITQVAKFTEPNDIKYGTAVAMSGNGEYVAVSSSYSNIVGSKVYVYRVSSGLWERQATIIPTSPNALAFGQSLALSTDGALLIIGDPLDTADGASAGTCYIYQRISMAWSLLTKIDISDPAAGKLYGNSVAINEDATIIAVGSPSSIGSGYAGSVYVFSLNRLTYAWSQSAKILQQGNIQNTLFGNAIDISADGKYLAIGAPSSNQAHIYNNVNNAWVKQFTLFPTNAPAQSRFGTNVKISGDGNFCLVCDPTGGVGGYIIAYGKSGTNWVQLQLINETVQNIGNRFGQSIAISFDGTKCVVGADGVNQSTGRTYAYNRNGLAYDEDAVFGPSDIAGGIRFGYATSMSSDGATTISSAIDANAAYIFIK